MGCHESKDWIGRVRERELPCHLREHETLILPMGDKLDKLDGGERLEHRVGLIV